MTWAFTYISVDLGHSDKFPLKLLTLTQLFWGEGQTDLVFSLNKISKREVMNAFLFDAMGAKSQILQYIPWHFDDRHFFSIFRFFCLFDCRDYFAEQWSITSADYLGGNYRRILLSTHPTDSVFSNCFFCRPSRCLNRTHFHRFLPSTSFWLVSVWGV